MKYHRESTADLFAVRQLRYPLLHMWLILSLLIFHRKYSVRPVIRKIPWNIFKKKNLINKWPQEHNISYLLWVFLCVFGLGGCEKAVNRRGGGQFKYAWRRVQLITESADMQLNDLCDHKRAFPWNAAVQYVHIIIKQRWSLEGWTDTVTRSSCWVDQLDTLKL